MGGKPRLWMAAILAVALVVHWGWDGWAAPRAAAFAVDAKDADLSAVLELIAAGGGPKLQPHPEVATAKVSFAAKQLAPTAAVRWLARSCDFAALKGKDGTLVLGKPEHDKAVVKQYKVARLAATQARGDVLTGFVSKVLFAAFPSRSEDAEGQAVPKLDVKWAKGRLKVLAPAAVQREVLALLTAMAKAGDDGDIEPMKVKYGSYDLGFFRTSMGAEPPPMKGNVSLELADAPAAEAARQLTVQCKTSFYIDAWDEGLREATVSLSAADQPLSVVAQKVAKALGAELLAYDGAWLFVREARKPLYESLIVRVYNISGKFFGRSIGDFVEQRANQIPLPKGLPYAIERVGDRFLVSLSGQLHKQFEDLLSLRRPGGPAGEGWRERIPKRWRDLMPR